MSQHELKRKLDESFDRKQDKFLRIKGWLGNNQGVVQVPNRDNYSYVTYETVSGSTLAAEVFNVRTPYTPMLAVWVGFDPDEPSRAWQVLGLRQTDGEESGGLLLGPHAETHRWLGTGTGGGMDVLFVEGRQFMPFRIGADSGLSVALFRGVYKGDAWYEIAAQSIDLTSEVPATADKALFVLITLSTTGTIVTTTGSEVDDDALALTDIPAAPAGTKYELAAIRLYEGQTEIQESRTSTDIVDLRFPIAHTHDPSEIPGGGGDMTKAVYDTDNDGVVDNSEALGGVAAADYLTEAEHTAIGNGSPHHAPVTLGVGSDPALSLSGQELTLGDIVTQAELDALSINDLIASAAPGGTLNLLTTPVTIISIGNHNGFPNIARLSNGDLMVVYRDAADHSASKGVIKYQTSSDNGDTWSAQSTIFSDATYDCRDPGIVVLDSGRIVVSFFKWDHTASPETWANSGLADAVHTTYSDNNGSSWSAPVALNSAFQKTASPGSPILLPDGTLRLAQYGVKDVGDTFRSASIFTSSDNGESWGTEIVIADGEADSRLYEEPCITYLHTGEILCLIRSDTTSQFFRTISRDTGLTWTDPVAAFAATGKPFNMQLKNGMVITIYRATADAQADYRISRDNGYSWEDAAELHATSAIRMAYASAVEYDEGILGVVVSDEDTSSDANLFFYRFYTTVEGGQLVSNVPDGTAPIVVESQTLVTNLNADMVDGFHASELVYDYILIRDQKTAGTEGGTFTSGAWQTRVLNTEAADTGSRASISSNQITLAAGTYRVRVRCPGFMVVNHKARLQNITDGTVILIGSSEYNTSASATAMNYSEIVGRFTIAAPKVIEVQHRCTTTRADNGFGVAANIDSLVEVYTIVEMWREPS